MRDSSVWAVMRLMPGFTLRPSTAGTEDHVEACTHVGNERRASSRAMKIVNHTSRREGEHASVQVRFRYLETSATPPAADWGLCLAYMPLGSCQCLSPVGYLWCCRKVWLSGSLTSVFCRSSIVRTQREPRWDTLPLPGGQRMVDRRNCRSALAASAEGSRR